MRHQKLITIFKTIYDYGSASRDQLARTVEISSASISNVVKSLLKADLIRVRGERPSRGGRRALLFEVNGSARYVIGVDLQGDSVRIGLCDMAGQVVRTCEERLEISPQLPVSRFLEDLKAFASALAPNQAQRLLAVGISVPGILDRAGETILSSGRIPWINLPLRDLVQRALGLPVYLARSVHADVLAEKWFGVARDASDCIFVSTGRGVGCGILFGGSLYTGTSLMAGEFGHTKAEPDGIPCVCGSRGCLEAYVSDRGIVSLYQSKRRGKVEANFGFKDLLKLARNGNAEALEAIQTASDYLGRGISGLIHVLNPEMVILGGTLAEASDIFFPGVEKAMARYTLPPLSSCARIVPSSLERDIGLKGAAALALQQIIHNSDRVEELLKTSGRDSSRMGSDRRMRGSPAFRNRSQVPGMRRLANPG